MVLAFLFRITLTLAMPALLRKVTGYYDLDCTYNRLQLSLLGGDVGLYGLEIRPRNAPAATPPVISSGYCRLSINPLRVLRGRLDVWRVEADDIEMALDRQPDGRLPLLDRILTASASKSVRPTTGSQTYDLTSPLHVEAFRLAHIRAHFRDQSVTPNFDTTIQVDFRVSDLGSDTKPTRFEMTISADPILDELFIEGQGSSSGPKLDVQMHVLARGIHPQPAAPYLAPLGLKPVADNLVARMSAHLRTSAAAAPLGGMAVSLELQDLSLRADGNEQLALDHLLLTADSLESNVAKFSRLVLEGVRANTLRSPGGRLRLAGLELDPTIVTPPRAAPPSPVGSAPVLVASTQNAAPIQVSLNDFTLNDLRLNFVDQSAAAPAVLQLLVSSFSAHNLTYDPAHPDAVISLAGAASAPGMARTIDFSGTVTPFAANKLASFHFSALGIRPDALKPYFDAAGIESQIKNATLTCDLQATLTPEADGTLAAEGRLEKLRMDDGTTPLVAFDAVRFSGVSVRPATDDLKIASIEIAGPALDIIHLPDGQFASGGFRTKSATLPAATAPAIVPATTSPTAEARNPLPETPSPAPNTRIAGLFRRIQLDHFLWNGLGVNLEDQAVTPAVKIPLHNAGFELSKIVLDASAKEPIMGTLHAWLAVPGVAEKCDLTGTIAPSPNSLVLDLHATAEGLNTTSLSGYLRHLGIDPVLQNGSVQFSGKAIVEQSASALRASLDLHDVRFKDGSDTLASMDAFAADHLSLSPTAFDAGTIVLTKPAIRITHNADGTFLLGGLRLRPSDFPTAATAPASRVSATAPVNSPVLVTLHSLTIDGAAITWTDRATPTPIETTATVGVLVENLTLGKSAAPAALRFTAKTDGSLDDLRITGSLSPEPQSAHLAIAAHGFRAAQLAPYLPSNVQFTPKDGNLELNIDAQLAADPAGGHRVAITFSNLSYGDGSKSLLAFDSAQLVASRIDPALKIIALDQISLAGLDASAAKSSDGALAFLGFTIHPGPEKAEAYVAPSHAALPLITLDTLDLKLKQFQIADASRPAAAPLTFSNVRLRNTNRIEWLGEDAAAKPPTNFQLTGRVGSLVDSLALDMEVAPFASPLTLNADLLASGINGEGVTALVPELKSLVDGATLTNGEFRAQFSTAIRIDRRNPADLDLSRDFSATVHLHDVEFRATPTAPVLLGLEDLQSDDVRVQPKSGTITIKTLEITKPIAHAFRDGQGLHVLGLTIKLPAEPTASQISPLASTSSQPAESSANAAISDTHGVKPSLTISKLLLSNIDLRAEDRTFSPPVVVPFTGLDAEVQDFSSLAFAQETRPIRFNFMLNSGKVPTGKEEQDLFAQITGNGNLSLFPNLKGYVKTSFSALELPAFSGAARSAGVALSSGLCDGSTTLRFYGDGTGTVNTRITFTDLTVAEPDAGPIASTLRLPAPLNTAIAALEDADGSITVPLSFPLKNGRFSPDDIKESGIEAFLPIVTTGIASLPLKLLNVGDNSRTEEAPAVVPFAPGSDVLDPAAAANLESVAGKLRDNSSLEVILQHNLGDEDVARARLRANPSYEDSLNILAQLRRKKSELLNLRAEAASEARSLIASRLEPTSVVAALFRVRALDREIAQTDDALDAICDLLAPGADLRADRRTRAAAINLGAERLETLRAALLATDIPHIADRIHIVHAKFNPPASPGPADTSASPNPPISPAPPFFPISTGGQVTATLHKVEKK
jgi:hypothetical protein